MMEAEVRNYQAVQNPKSCWGNFPMSQAQTLGPPPHVKSSMTAGYLQASLTTLE